MADIFSLINAKQIGGFITELASNSTPYLGQVLFPNKSTDRLSLEWFKGANGLPVALMPSSFDSKATVRERIGVSKVETEIPFFRESMRLGELDRQKVVELLSNTRGDVYSQEIIRRIFDDAYNLYLGAEVQAERMRMQLLSTGQIDITDNSTPYEYNYNMDSGHKVDVDNAWTDAENADPVADIESMLDKIEDDTGTRPTQAICSRKTFGYLKASEKIRADMFLTSGASVNAVITDDMVKAYLLSKFGLTVAIYNKKYRKLGIDGRPSTTSNQFFPDDVFTLIPDTTLGNTYYGRTPEEVDLLSGGSTAQIQIVGGGIAITTIKEPHPVNVQTIVSGLFLPSFEMIDTVGILNVNP